MKSSSLKYIFLLPILLILSINGWAQINWANFTEGSLVYAIKYYNGNVWIGTCGGLVKYDVSTHATKFFNKTTSGLPDNHVISIAADNGGHLWLGTYNGMATFDGTNWTTYNTSNSPLPNNFVGGITVSTDNTIWFCTANNYLVKIKNGIWTTYPPSVTGLANCNMYSKITIENDSSIWICDYTNGLIHFDGTNFHLFDENNSPLLPGKRLYDVNIIGDTMWVAAWSCLIRIVDTAWTVYNHVDFGQASSAFTQTMEDSHHNFWIATGYGLISIDPIGLQTNFTSINSGLPCDNVWQMEEDPSGALWFGTFGRGLGKFDGTSWSQQNTSETDLINNEVREMQFDQDSILWGIADNIDCMGASHSRIFSYNLKTQQWHTYTKAIMGLDFYEDNIKSLMVDKDNNKWFLADQGLLQFNNSSWQYFPMADSIFSGWENALYGICDTSTETIYVFMKYHILTFHSGVYASFNIADLGFASFDDVIISDACFDKNSNLWLLAHDIWNNAYLLLKYDGANNSHIQLSSFGQYSYPNKIKSDLNGNVWISHTTGQLEKYDGSVLNTELSLGNVGSLGLAFDQNNNLWLCTYQGIFCHTTGGITTNYNISNSGLAGDGAMCIAFDPYNNKWVGSDYSGISVFNEKGILLPEPEQPGQPSDYLNFPFIYPNPASDYFFINMPLLPTGEDVRIELYNILGDLVIQKKVTAEDHVLKVETGTLSTGIYLVKVSSQSCNEVFKLIIE